jgi:hypothetical protein
VPSTGEKQYKGKLRSGVLLFFFIQAMLFILPLNAYLHNPSGDGGTKENGGTHIVINQIRYNEWIHVAQIPLESRC